MPPGRANFSGRRCFTASFPEEIATSVTPSATRPNTPGHPQIPLTWPNAGRRWLCASRAGAGQEETKRELWEGARTRLGFRPTNGVETHRRGDP